MNNKGGMDRLKRSLTGSFRKKKKDANSKDEGDKPHLWAQDEISVKAANCTFYVKVLIIIKFI